MQCTWLSIFTQYEKKENKYNALQCPLSQNIRIWMLKVWNHLPPRSQICKHSMLGGFWLGSSFHKKPPRRPVPSMSRMLITIVKKFIYYCQEFVFFYRHIAFVVADKLYSLRTGNLILYCGQLFCYNFQEILFVIVEK